ncbi:MAG: hypothetical protein M1133_08280 [Armatimonadetes bacterium]|nr:hypothetical protein [Armatimonadota bacterium]
MRNLNLVTALVALGVVCIVVPGRSDTALPNGGWDAAWSPDGSTIAFTAGSPHGIPDLWLIKADKTGLKRMTVRGAHEPKWLPDGKTIVFGTLRKGNTTFMSIDANGEPDSEKPVDALPAGAENPVWSPDGSLVAYGMVSNDGNSRDLKFARMAGGGSTGLATKFWCREWVWSPDGSTIAFIVGRSTGTSIWTVNIATKEMKLIYKGFCAALAYSPDGKQLAMAIPDVRSGFKIAIIDFTTGMDKRIGVRTFNGEKLIWSNDGTKLYFQSSRKSEPAIWRIGTDGKNLTRLTSQGMPTRGAALSPDGTKIACQVSMLSSYSPELAVCRSTGGVLEKFTTSSSASYWSPVWSPDGKLLAFQSDVNHKTELFTGTPNGRMGKALTKIMGSDPAEVSWFPNGKKLIMADIGRLLIVNVAGGKDAVKPLVKLMTQVQGPQLIGNEVLLTEWGMRDANLSAYKLDGSGKRFVTQKPEDQPKPEPKQNGEQKPEPGKVSKPDADASTPHRTGAGPEAETGNPHSDLGLMGPQKNVGANRFPPIFDLWPALSPDRKTVAFVRNDQLWLVNTDGANGRQITQFKPAEGVTHSLISPCWSPKGDAILFTAFNTELNKLTLQLWTCNLEAGSERLVYSENIDTEYGVYYTGCTNPPVFMPDGQRILFTSVAGIEPRIASISLDGGNLKEIVPAPASFPSLDSTGKRLAFVDLSNSRESIRIMDMTTGKLSGALFRK